MTDHERGKIDRRSLIAKGAAAGGVLWAAPVIESFVSKAAAASNGLTCKCAIIFYEHADGRIYTISFTQGSNGTTGCTGGTAACCSTSVTCNGVTYTVSGVSGTTATAGTTSVGAAPGQGDCNGQFTITGSTIAQGGTNPSNTILAGIALTNGGACVTACPTGTGTGNSITFPGC
jgi:hypothetical protein